MTPCSDSDGWQKGIHWCPDHELIAMAAELY